MIIIGIVLSFVLLAYLCWLLFSLAVYALPFFAGATAGLAAYHGGSGPIGAAAIGLIASAAILVAGQVGIAATRSPLIRVTIGLLFAAPAAVAGYHAALGLAHIAIPGDVWQQILALAAAIVVAATAWARLKFSAPPESAQGVAAGLAQSPFSRRRSSRTAEAAVRLKIGG